MENIAALFTKVGASMMGCGCLLVMLPIVAIAIMFAIVALKDMWS